MKLSALQKVCPCRDGTLRVLFPPPLAAILSACGGVMLLPQQLLSLRDFSCGFAAFSGGLAAFVTFLRKVCPCLDGTLRVLFLRPWRRFFPPLAAILSACGGVMLLPQQLLSLRDFSCGFAAFSSGIAAFLCCLRQPIAALRQLFPTFCKVQKVGQKTL